MGVEQATGTGLVLSPHYGDHDTGSDHPESAARLTALLEGLKRTGLLQRCTAITPCAACDEALLRCHSQGYLHTVERDVACGKACLSTGDTAIGQGRLVSALEGGYALAGLASSAAAHVAALLDASQASDT